MQQAFDEASILGISPQDVEAMPQRPAFLQMLMSVDCPQRCGTGECRSISQRFFESAWCARSETGGQVEAITVMVVNGVVVITYFSTWMRPSIRLQTG